MLKIASLALFTNSIGSDIPVSGGNDIIIASIGDNDVSSGGGNDIIISGSEDDTINGGAGNDVIAGLGGSDSLSGGEGNDTITGGGINISDDEIFVTEDTSGIDTLTGGMGEDTYVLGGQSADLAGEEATVTIHYDEAGNNDYALITDFNPVEDTIHLGGATSDYHLGSSPINLPTGTALYQGAELIAIIQGNSQLSLDESYFQDSL